MVDGIKILQRVAARGAAIKVLDKPHLDLTTPIGQGLLGLLSAIADDERQRIAKRSGEGRKAAKARGVKMGAPSKLSEHQKGKAIERLEEGDSCSEIGRDMGVSRSTISRLRTSKG